MLQEEWHLTWTGRSYRVASLDVGLDASLDVGLDAEVRGSAAGTMVGDER